MGSGSGSGSGSMSHSSRGCTLQVGNGAGAAKAKRPMLVSKQDARKAIQQRSGPCCWPTASKSGVWITKRIIQMFTTSTLPGRLISAGTFVFKIAKQRALDKKIHDASYSPTPRPAVSV